MPTVHTILNWLCARLAAMESSPLVRPFSSPSPLSSAMRGSFLLTLLRLVNVAGVGSGVEVEVEATITGDASTGGSWLASTSLGRLSEPFPSSLLDGTWINSIPSSWLVLLRLPTPNIPRNDRRFSVDDGKDFREWGELSSTEADLNMVLREALRFAGWPPLDEP